MLDFFKSVYNWVMRRTTVDSDGPVRITGDSSLPAIPDVTSQASAPVLASYGQTMLYVQRFERTLKFLLVMFRGIDSEVAESFDEDNFWKLHDQTHSKALKRVLDGLRAWMKEHELAPMPREAHDMLMWMVLIRNYLAHDYLVEHAPLLNDPESQLLMQEELKFFAQIFGRMDRVWMKWVDPLMEGLGFTEEDLEKEYNEHRNSLKELAIENLKERIDAWDLDES